MVFGQDTIAYCILGIAGANFAFALVRTYFNIRVTRGSERYWVSWKDRSKDVARSVLKEISTLELEQELSRRSSKKNKKKKRRRKKKIEK